MNRTQTLAVAVLAILLPFAQTAFARDEDHSDRGRSEYESSYDHDQHHGHHDRHYRSHRGHYHGHHYCNEDHRYNHYQSQYNHGNQYNYGGQVGIRLPFPPLPPFPVIILKKPHH